MVNVCYQDPSPFGTALGIVLTLAIVVSYLPQFWVIFKAKSSKGVSFFTMWLGYMSAALTLINEIILKWEYISCCQHLDAWRIIKNLLPIEQLTSGPVSLFGLAIMVLLFYDVTPSANQTAADKRRERNQSYALLIFAAFVTAVILGGSLAIILWVDADSEGLHYFADVIGIVSSVFVVVMWCPQIYITWKLQHTGNLSLGLLLLQTPGAVIVIIYQAGFNDASWTTWLPYFATSVQLCVLLFLYIWFRWMYKCIYKKKIPRIQPDFKIVEDDYSTDAEKVRLKDPAREAIIINEAQIQWEEGT
eukprot:TRINITY_DN4404_c0_g1_i1.p1 TRINITY_DN4404_c0_g1~~TRINITY_DN4404_c0_g1_i1.p1  ORF type:complete len:304 (+),score=44.17 TRINITY_DN4404_c0_g1_i1:39-950(+)